MILYSVRITDDGGLPLCHGVLHIERLIELEIMWLIFYVIKLNKSGSNLNYPKHSKEIK
jgi:hypothetical protein